MDPSSQRAPADIIDDGWAPPSAPPADLGVVDGGAAEPVDPDAAPVDPNAQPSTDAAGRVHWLTPSARFDAAALVLGVGDETIAAPRVPGSLKSDGVGDNDTVEAIWFDAEGREQRVFVYLQRDDADWWIGEIWTYGRPVPADQQDWIVFQGPFPRVPLGQALTGDLDLVASDFPGARLAIRGLTLQAFQGPCTEATPPYSSDALHGPCSSDAAFRACRFPCGSSRRTAAPSRTSATSRSTSTPTTRRSST